MADDEVYQRFTTTGGAGYGVFNAEWPRDFNPDGSSNFGVHGGSVEVSMPKCPHCLGSKVELFMDRGGRMREKPCRLCAGHGEIPRAVYEKIIREISFRISEGQ